MITTLRTNNILQWQQEGLANITHKSKKKAMEFYKTDIRLQEIDFLCI